MIARSSSRCQPIPFADPLHEPRGLSSRAVRWSPPPPMSPLVARQAPMASWMAKPSEGMHSANDARHTPSRPAAQAVPVRQPGTPVLRQATARYDGPHSLSVRSSATGRHYRFPQQGATQVIDAADIALMRRIEDITLL